MAAISRVVVIRRQSSNESPNDEDEDEEGGGAVAAAADGDVNQLGLPDPPVAILIDSNMPVMNGPDAVVEIRKLGYHFPIFGVTGDEEIETFIRAGADGVMLKPVKSEELLHRCAASLAHPHPSFIRAPPA